MGREGEDKSRRTRERWRTVKRGKREELTNKSAVGCRGLEEEDEEEGDDDDDDDDDEEKGGGGKGL